MSPRSLLFCCGALIVACNGTSEPRSRAAPRAAGRQEVPAPAPLASTAPAKAVAPPVHSAPPADAGPADAALADAAREVAHADIPPGMLPVPGGTFIMGADEGGEKDEHPAHKVTLKGFLLDKTEVTNKAYLECVHAKVCRMYRTDAAVSFHAGPDSAFRHPKQPVSAVSWNDALTYCKWRGKRLPTEAEWEHAARGDDGRKYPWGNTPPDPEKDGCYSGSPRPCAGTTAPVGSFPAGAGPYGHLDLAGNVWEWTASYYDPMAYTRSTADQGIPGTCPEILKSLAWLRKHDKQGFTGSNPIPSECERVLRGGAYNYFAKGLRSSNRVHHPGRFRILVAGFRCAKDR